MKISEQEEKTTPRLRVLIADDSKETRRGTRLMLSLVPAVEVVAIAHDGLDAIGLTQKHKPDIAIVDINMPEMDGISAIQSMLQIKPEMGCIIISAEHDSEMLRNAMSAGAREYLVKPFTVDELEQAVLRVRNRVLASWQRSDQIARLQSQRLQYLQQLAQEYIKSRRLDDQAVDVFEELAADPACELRWLMNLALIYLLRREWGKLATLAERLEREAST